MNIQGFAGITSAYSAYGSVRTQPSSTATGVENPSSTASTQVSISDQAKALASSDGAVNARLESIKAKPALERSTEDVEFLQRNDKKLAEILAKDPKTQTADDIDYMQKAGGFVNTMANLSPQEKQLYDELVAKGDTDAVAGMNLIALSRMGGGQVTLANGKTFNPTQTTITSDNIRQLFSQMFVSSDDQNAKSFDALAKYLDHRSSQSA